ncbi:carboxypeptidase M isoform X2 [Neocloeon triangulifer]|uniref:carboxypeptidase M isoform X2 n=1 Tax=Neocloeon triangulifer TaxID=2078957 RepID=UPI00286F965D|nr:carboxypeptidase M isoform X2 [Neocloeon triangulifer]
MQASRVSAAPCCNSRGMRTGSWCTSTLVVGLIYLYILAVEEVMGQQADTFGNRPAGFNSPDQFYPGAAQGQGSVFNVPVGDAGASGPAKQFSSSGAAGLPYYGVDFKYHNYNELTDFLRTTSSQFPNLTALYSIGKSVQGRDLWVMVVSASPYEHIIGKPDVKYVANMHGNEAVGREMMLHLIHYLVTSYESDQYIRWLLDNTRIHILPSMNPDGFEVAREGTCDGGQGRYNALGFDLNRNFPDYFKQNVKNAQPETEAVKEWVSKIQFTLSGSLHGGALVASYPFDNTPAASLSNYNSPPSVTPDDDVFKHLALTYSSNHEEMHRGEPCKPGTPSFNQGITNGAAWYPLTGGMQDYNYVWYGCMEVTIEMSCCKYPPKSQLPKFWEQNRLPLVKFLAEAHRGVHGFVQDENGNPIEKASLKVKGREVGFHTTKYGEFWRVLMPGQYSLSVFAEGYFPRDVEFMVVEQHPTLLNVTLRAAKRSDGFYRPPQGPPGPNFYHPQHANFQKQPVDNNAGIFSSISTGFNSLVSNIFG